MTRPARILYVDDDPGMRRLVQRDLQRHGCEVAVAESGPEGERMAAEGEYDAICLDHYMPGQDGLETLTRLRARPGTPPVIFVTGSEEGRLAVAALRAGAADYVIKEASGEFLPLLRATLDDALEREELRRAKDQALAELREARDRAETLAGQRAVLLREVNHRVANSLQLLTSLISLQQGRLHDPAARQALADVRSRIQAVAQVHRRLYTGDDVRSVALDEYLDGLLAELGRSIGDAPGTARIQFTAAKLRVTTDQAISLGVIAAELVTNAIKYAYPDRDDGPVRVALETDGASAVLRVEDDGIGHGDADPIGTGLGHTVIRAMAEGIGGGVRHGCRPLGVCVEVRFPIAGPAPLH